MEPCERRAGMTRRPAFISHPFLFRHRHVLKTSSSSVQSRPGYLAPHAPPHRQSRLVSNCSTSKPPGSKSSSEPPPKQQEPSRTLPGRVAVEVFSLIVGAALLVLVLIWRATQIVSSSLWKALAWLSNVRLLGKWAVRRVTSSNTNSLSPASFARLIAGIYAAAKATVTGLKKTNSTTIVETIPIEEERSADEDDTSVEAETSPDVHESSDETAHSFSGRRLILLRHANTTWDRASETPDHDRVLSARGKEEARLVGSELGKLGWLPDVVLCSDAVRTVQTLSLLDIPDRKPAPTTCTESLYYAVTGDEMAVAVDETLGEEGFTSDTTLMVVCHNPGCEELVEQLSGHRAEMGTGCAALLEYCGSSTSLTNADSDVLRLSPQSRHWSLVHLIRPSSLSSATM